MIDEPRGLPRRVVENAACSLAVSTTIGPRILSLCLRGQSNLFADVPGATLECPGVGAYHLRGGHRLWHAPEIPGRTYLPDDAPPQVLDIAGGLVCTQPTESSTGLAKSMRIRVHPDRALVYVEHTLANLGLTGVRCAPWAITQLRPGGFAVLPHPIGPADPEGLWANRRIALWPYTDVRDPNLAWGNAFSFVHARAATRTLKLGFPNPVGWLGYYVGRTLFVKRAAYDPRAEYPDHGSSSQCYANAQCLELETLGPLVELAPGATAQHREIWQVFAHVDLEPSEASAARVADELALHPNSTLEWMDEVSG